MSKKELKGENVRPEAAKGEKMKKVVKDRKISKKRYKVKISHEFRLRSTDGRTNDR